MARALLALGGNLGDVPSAFVSTLRQLALSGNTVLCTARLYRNRALIHPEAEAQDAVQPDYWNSAALVETPHAPHALLAICAAIEEASGRQRQRRWQARTLDIDLLLFGDVALADRQLQLPHPQLARRSFVLRPALDIAGPMRLPGNGPSIAELAAAHADLNEGIIEVRAWGAADAPSSTELPSTAASDPWRPAAQRLE